MQLLSADSYTSQNLMAPTRGADLVSTYHLPPAFPESAKFLFSVLEEGGYFVQVKAQSVRICQLFIFEGGGWGSLYQPFPG